MVRFVEMLFLPNQGSIGEMFTVYSAQTIVILQIFFMV